MVSDSRRYRFRICFRRLCSRSSLAGSPQKNPLVVEQSLPVDACFSACTMVAAQGHQQAKGFAVVVHVRVLAVQQQGDNAVGLLFDPDVAGGPQQPVVACLGPAVVVEIQLHGLDVRLCPFLARDVGCDFQQRLQVPRRLRPGGQGNRPAGLGRAGQMLGGPNHRTHRSQGGGPRAVDERQLVQPIVDEIPLHDGIVGPSGRRLVFPGDVGFDAAIGEPFLDTVVRGADPARRQVGRPVFTGEHEGRVRRAPPVAGLGPVQPDAADHTQRIRRRFENVAPVGAFQQDGPAAYVWISRVGQMPPE